jgi:hypothetical protein
MISHTRGCRCVILLAALIVTTEAAAAAAVVRADVHKYG